MRSSCPSDLVQDLYPVAGPRLARQHPSCRIRGLSIQSRREVTLTVWPWLSTRDKTGSVGEIADVYEVDFNGRHALRVSVSPPGCVRRMWLNFSELWQTLIRKRRICPSVQVPLEPKQQTEMCLRFIPWKKRVGMNRDDKSQIHRERNPGAPAIHFQSPTRMKGAQ